MSLLITQQPSNIFPQIFYRLLRSVHQIQSAMSPRLSVRRKTPPLAPANVQMEPTTGFKNCIHSALTRERSSHSGTAGISSLGTKILKKPQWTQETHVLKGNLEGQGLGRECLSQCHVTHPCVSSVSLFMSFFRFQGPHWIQWFIP